MPISAPPPTPNRTNPTTFSQRMDDYLAWFTANYAAFNALALGQFDAQNNFYLGSVNAILGMGVGRINSQGLAATGYDWNLLRGGAGSGTGPALNLGKTRSNAVDSYTIITAGDALGNVNFWGADGSTMIKGAYIQGYNIGTPAAGDVRGGVRAYTGSGANATALRWQIDDTLVGHYLPFGYATGAGVGGAATQITSRNTGVTLNKIAGDITLFTAAGSATPFSFTVTNSQMGLNDNVIPSVKSATNKYALFITAKAAGSFEITGYALSGVASDAPVIHFDIIKSTIN